MSLSSIDNVSVDNEFADGLADHLKFFLNVEQFVERFFFKIRWAICLPYGMSRKKKRFR